MSGRLKQWLVFALFLGTAIYAIAEDITLTTYYPSPRGVYQELKTAGDMVVGDITNPPAARLHVVQEGTAPALRVDDVPGDTSPVLVDASGNVGIGTASPSQRLHVAGNALIESGQLQVGNLSSDPAAIGDGAIYYNTTSQNFRGFQGGAWQDMGGGGGLTAVQAFTSSGTYTVPPGVTKIMVEVWGGGGGGGGSAGTGSGGAGGGGGGYANGVFTVIPSTAYSITVGAGGAGAPAGGGAGGSGDASSFSSLISASGGTGGGGSSGAAGSTRGSGGTGSGGQSNLQGQDGHPGYSGFAMGWFGGEGGSAGGGGGGGGRGGVGACGVCIQAENGKAPGGGGGAGGTYGGPEPSGAGVGGAVIVWEYGP